jgi:6-phosphogluconolactonase (cycloisomerase 2 family)
MILQARVVLLSILSLGAFVVVAAESHAATGDITYAGCLTGELGSGGSGTAACEQITEAGDNGDGTAFDALRALAISPDGTSAYAASRGDAAILHFSRDAASGVLRVAGCVTGDLGAEDVCDTIGAAAFGANNSGLDFLQDVIVSPDGKHVYAASHEDDAIARFSRDLATGQLTYAGCVSGETDSDAACALTAGATPDGSRSGLNKLQSLAISPDGRTIYAVAQDDDSVVRFDRDAATGALSFAGCITGESTPNACAPLGGARSGLNFPRSLAISADGRHVYVGAAADDAISVFARGANGALSHAGCITATTDVSSCSRIPTAAVGGDETGLSAPNDLALSPDGTSLYAASNSDDAITRFSRAADGSLTFGGCITGESESARACTRVDGDAPAGADSGLDGLSSIALSADGLSIYATAERDAAVVRFTRDPATGAHAFASCISGETETAIAGCAQVGSATADGLDSGFDAPADVAISPDGTSVYSASLGDDAVAAFARETAPQPADDDTSAPVLELRAARKQPARGAIVVSAACDEACSAEITASGRVSGAARGKGTRRIAVRAVRAEIDAGGAERLRLRFAGAKAQRLARKALAGDGRISVRVRGTATDAAGNAATDRLKINLNRRETA